MALTIDDLLNALESEDSPKYSLLNNEETWTRIGNKDAFLELGMKPDELDIFLKEWMENNPYSAI